MSSQSIHLRLPRRLYRQLKDVADEEGVSLNTLMTALLAGSTGFTLDPAAPPASRVLTSSKGASLMADSRDRNSKPTGYYKVDRQLRQAFPIALKPQPSGVSVDARLYFREKPNGDLWGGLALLDDEDGEIIEQMPLADPTGLMWLLGVLCKIGFDAAPEERTKPRDG
jgi:hypothetical protein